MDTELSGFSPMKLKHLPGLLLLAVVAAGAFFLGRSTMHDRAAASGAMPAGERTFYTCGMHPQVIQDRPGNCPICRMKLTPMRRSPVGTGTKDETAAHRDGIVIDPVTVQNMGIRLTVVTNGPLRRTLRTVGVIEPSETALVDVTIKFRGWIEKLHVNYTGARVRKGEPLFEIYSPELYSAQVEYLSLLGSDPVGRPGAESLRRAARMKLRYWDITDDQIAELETTGTPRKTLTVVAPGDGFVLEKHVVEGQMVQPGERMYRLADLSVVWVHAQVYEQDLPFVEVGQEAIVTLSYLPGQRLRGSVRYVYPNLDEKSRTVRVRVELPNPDFLLRPGMYARVELSREVDPAALLVPESAVVRSGTRNTVFVALGKGKFEPRQVALGPRADNDMVQIRSGLQPGERVVVSGQFMLDSESQLREALLKMLEPGPTGAVMEKPEASNPTGRAPAAAASPPMMNPGTR
ncbi:efflux RND transporter periplasmic adaptor subunit [Limisphaera ngatamarikiensis]|uniref:Efflux RND transporter periplasmic adaptor subunit n=1 Tax=Limisphaera ngatamarikiensis TaxID=1324935 RepID=A0A6M1RGV8_9BACT|nr:efflux RND transporter periplasmic adaptor subunit [Limisphaera ngatamarikiensis]NGO39288.1 efflux RND transporter periplasmic adaptor subunit [Limisphaera ngatamarikiensis]